MLSRSMIVLVLVLVLLATLAVPVLGGGWAAVTLDSLPRELRAGQPLHLGFTVRQHGVTPVNDAEPTLVARNPETGEMLQFAARKEGAAGHYELEVTFPSAGTWEWGIIPAPFPEVVFEPLAVLPAHTAALEISPTDADVSTLWWPFQMILWVLRAAPEARATSAIQPMTDAAYGRALFAAKGCTACHMHSTLSRSVSGPVIGPNLTNYRPEPDFVRRWLRNPAAVRPGTQMPDLDLSEAEINAIIAFLNGDSGEE